MTIETKKWDAEIGELVKGGANDLAASAAKRIIEALAVVGIEPVAVLRHGPGRPGIEVTIATDSETDGIRRYFGCFNDGEVYWSAPWSYATDPPKRLPNPLAGY